MSVAAEVRAPWVNSVSGRLLGLTASCPPPHVNSVPGHGHVLVRDEPQAGVERRLDVEHLGAVPEVDPPDAVGRLGAGQPDPRPRMPARSAPLALAVWRSPPSPASGSAWEWRQRATKPDNSRRRALPTSHASPTRQRKCARTRSVAIQPHKRLSLWEALRRCRPLSEMWASYPTLPNVQFSRRTNAWKRHPGSGHTTLGKTFPSESTRCPRSVRTCPDVQAIVALKRSLVDG